MRVWFPCVPLKQLAVEEEDVLKEAFFAPSDGDGATLQALFEAFSQAAEMNPEVGEDGEEPEGEGELVFDDGRLDAGLVTARATGRMNCGFDVAPLDAKTPSVCHDLGNV